MKKELSNEIKVSIEYKIIDADQELTQHPGYWVIKVEYQDYFNGLDDLEDFVYKINDDLSIEFSCWTYSDGTGLSGNKDAWYTVELPNDTFFTVEQLSLIVPLIPQIINKFLLFLETEKNKLKGK